MAQETTTTQELQYLIRQITKEFDDNMPADLGFVMLVYHKGDGAVGWSIRDKDDTAMGKARSIVRAWLERAEKMVTHE